MRGFYRVQPICLDFPGHGAKNHPKGNADPRSVISHPPPPLRHETYLQLSLGEIQLALVRQIHDELFLRHLAKAVAIHMTKKQNDEHAFQPERNTRTTFNSRREGDSAHAHDGNVFVSGNAPRISTTSEAVSGNPRGNSEISPWTRGLAGGGGGSGRFRAVPETPTVALGGASTKPHENFMVRERSGMMVLSVLSYKFAAGGRGSVS